MPEVALERVTYPLPILRDVMRGGYVLHFGHEPSDGELGYGWSVARLETGGKTWNNNFGNVKCFPECQKTKPWVDIGPKLSNPCPLDTTLPAPKGCEYPAQRAYGSGAQGAERWWAVLDAKRYDGVLELAAEGRAYDACYLMGEAGYYGADKDLYSSQVEAIYKEYVSQYGGPLPSDPPGPGPTPEPLQAGPGIFHWSALLLGCAAGWFGYLKLSR